jgi:hypothetical protein
MVTEATEAWRLISDPPPDGTAVLLYFANRRWRDGMGRPVEMNPIRDHVERTAVGWYEDGEWLESGTAHDLFEDWRGPDGFPTHWLPLAAPPEVST